MLLAGLVGLNLLSKFSNLLFMISLSLIEHLDIIYVDLLSLLGAEKFPDGERLILELLID